MFPWGLNRRSGDPTQRWTSAASLKSLNRRKLEGHSPKILRFEQDWPSALQTLPGRGDLRSVALSLQRCQTESTDTMNRKSAPNKQGWGGALLT